ncbi:MAG: copper oxidase, partial [Nitrosopumilus sp.]
MKNFLSKNMALAILIIAGVSTVFFVFPIISQAQVEEKTFVTMEGAVITTSGEVIDPVLTTATVDFDPDKFLREFNYGRVSQLEDG